MKSVGIRGSVVAAVASIFVLNSSITSPAQAQQAVLADNPELAAKGVWSNTVTYVTDDIVTSRGSAWIAKRNNRNKPPGQTAPSTANDWQLFARGFNPTGAWLNTPKYQPDDLVTFNGQTWRAKVTVPVNRPPAANAFWELFAAKGAVGPNNGIPDGSSNAPGISFDGDSDTGIYQPADGRIAIVANGVHFLHNLGTGNTGVGLNAIGTNSVGSNNTAVGAGALAANTSGVSNTAVGSAALDANTTGQHNTALGYNALAVNTTGNSNLALGPEVLTSNTSGSFNIALGGGAAGANTIANNNIAIGSGALASNQTGENNVAIGRNVLSYATTSDNTAVGYQALYLNTTGNSNTVVGSGALSTATTATSNTAIGTNALLANIDGNGNIAVGQGAGASAIAPTSSIFIGNVGATNDGFTIKIGTEGTQTSAYMAGIFSRSVDGNTDVPVIIDSAGKLGTAVSSRRYKYDIETMADVSAMLGKLRPVTFRYKQPQNGQHPLQYGLIAEEVAEVFPDLAVFNKDGSTETVKYHLLPNFLLAGYQSQQKTIASQAERIEALEARVAANAALEERLRRIEALLPQTRAAALQ